MMNPFSPKSKKQTRLNAARKQLPKSKRVFFVTLLAVVTLHFQTLLLEQTSVQGHAVQEGAFATGFLHVNSVQF